MKTVGARIKEARLSKKMTQAELAKQLGVAYQNIGQWESGKRIPKIENLQRLGEALGVSWVWLRSGDVFRDSEEAKEDCSEHLVQIQSSEHVLKLIEVRLGTYREIIKKEPYADSYVSATYHLFGQGPDAVAILEEDLTTIEEAVIALVKSLTENMTISVADAEEMCLKRLAAQKEVFQKEKLLDEST